MITPGVGATAYRVTLNMCRVAGPPCIVSLRLCICLNSINAVGVDITAFSGMANEEEVLLLPGLPLVNRPGENPERDLWTFEVETPDASSP